MKIKDLNYSVLFTFFFPNATCFSTTRFEDVLLYGIDSLLTGETLLVNDSNYIIEKINITQITGETLNQTIGVTPCVGNINKETLLTIEIYLSE